jgi:NAD(P)-dependent dehydrogenase (short-subunit alcohol dehydrogenase family)
LEFARRGARVVVNDLGGSTAGVGSDESAAARVVAEIAAAGGEAVANYDSVATLEGGERIINTALTTWGRVDTVVANAGILRDVSAAKLTVEQLDAVLDVHLRGAFFTVLPAFRWMKDNGGGRLILTTSASGLFGNFGQSNYAAAKMGIVGFMRVLSIEGARYGITANAIAPMAKTRLTGSQEDVVDDPMAPSRVTPIVVALGHQSNTVTGETFLSGSGLFARTFIAQAPGWYPGDRAVTAEEVVAHWDQIRDAANPVELPNALVVMEWLSGRTPD